MKAEQRNRTPSAGAASPARRNRARTRLTADEVAAAPWVRLPHPSERCKLTGLSRSGLIDLINRSGGAIKTARLHRPGAARGVVLVNRESLLAYLEAVANGKADVA